MIDELLKDAQERMHKSVEATRGEFGSVRTGRATPALLDRVMVDYYGTSTPLNQVATVSAPEARLLTVSPFDASSLDDIEIVRAAERYEGGGEEAFGGLVGDPLQRDPDLLIRTSGEQRISNFLLWQCAYSEFVFHDALWPDFSRDDLEDCLNEFTERERRFGGR